MAVITRRGAGRRSRGDEPAAERPPAGPAPALPAVVPATAVLAPGVPSWEEIVREHSARVYRLAYRLTGNPHDAEDLTQEVFVRVFRSLHTYTPDNFPGWLHRITTNLFLDKARRRSRLRFDALGDDAVERLSVSAPSSDRDLTDAMFDADIEQALAELPEEFRAAVVLCDVEGLSYDEIAEVLDVKLGTVRSRIHRGRKLLRNALAHRAPRGGRTRFSGPLDPATVAT